MISKDMLTIKVCDGALSTCDIDKKFYRTCFYEMSSRLRTKLIDNINLDLDCHEQVLQLLSKTFKYQ